MEDGPEGITVAKAVPSLQEVVMAQEEEVEPQQWSCPFIVVMVSSAV